MKRFLLLVGFLCLSAVVNAAWQDANSGLWVDWIDKNMKEYGVKVIQAPKGETAYSGSYTIPASIPSPEDPEVLVSVTEIAGSAFKGAMALIGVIIEAPITTINNETFQNSGLTSIVLPETVETIGSNAFSNTKLTYIIIPASVTSIGGSAFQGCSDLKKTTFASIEALCGITFAGNTSNPLYFTKQLYFADAPITPVAELTISNNVTTIPKYAFYNCESLTKVVLSEGIEYINGAAFANCINLSSVSIPNTMISIGSNAFLNDNNLNVARFASEKALCQIEYIDFGSNPLFYANKLYFGSSSERATMVSIPAESLENGNRVRPYILAGAQNLEKITLPKDATVIGTNAFSGCTGLKYAEYDNQDQLLDMEYENTEANPLNYAKELLINGSYPTKITFTKNVKARALINAPWLEVVEIEEGVTTIGASAFMNCKKLAIVSLPSTLTSIGDDAFNGCETMQAPSLPCGLLSIGNNAFYNCKGKSFTQISIPANCTIGVGAYKQCTALTTVSQMPTHITTIPDNCFENCYQLKSITIPNTVITIGNSAFKSCVALTNIPYGDTPAITEIGESAFSGCTNFTEVEIKSPVSTIKNSAFNGCTNMTLVNLPATIDDIRQKVFRGCTKLTSVIVNSDTPPTVGDDAFDGKQAQMKLYVKESAISSFSAKDIWKDFNGGVIETCGDYKLTFFINDKEKKVVKLPVGTTLDIADRNYKPALEDGDVFSGWDEEIPLTMPSENIKRYGYVSMKRDISGEDGEHKYKYKYHLQPAEAQNQKEKRATLIGVTLLDENYQSIKIPAEVTYDDVTYPVIAIGDSAFYSFDEKSQIQKVLLPESRCITEIGKVAFKGCNNLGEIENFDGIKVINESVFQNCSNLSTISISNDITKIGRLAFSGCSALNLTTLPSQLETISYQAFANTGIENVTVAKNTVLEDEVFKGCAKLETVVFAEGYNAPLPKLFFWNCTALKNVTLRGTMGSIHEGAFKGCTNLASINIPDGITQLGNDVFMSCTNLTKVILPSKGLKAISQSAFSGCTALSAITLPDNIYNIRQKAFTGCTSLNNITVQRNEAPTLVENAFDDATYQNTNLYVSNIANYNVSSWSKFQHKFQMGEYTLTYIVDGNTETPHHVEPNIMVGTPIDSRPDAVKEGHEFSGWQGEPKSMPGEDVTVYGKFKYELKFYENSVDENNRIFKDEEFKFFYGDQVILPIDVLSKAKHKYRLTFKVKDSDEIYGEPISEDDVATTDITMPAKDLDVIVTYEKAEYDYTYNNVNYKVYTFDNRAEAVSAVSGAKDVTIHATITYENKLYPVTIIQAKAFQKNPDIETVKIEYGINTIGDMAFQDCPRLKTVTLPAVLESIGLQAFSRSKLTSITVPYAPKMGKEIFYSCTKLNDIEFSPNLTKIPESIFRNCKGLEEIDIPDHITDIGKSAFEGCSALKTVRLSETLETIDDGAFSECEAIKELTLPASLNSIGNMAFYQVLGNEDVLTVNGDLPIAQGNTFDEEEKEISALLKTSATELPTPWSNFAYHEPLEEGGTSVPQCQKPVITYGTKETPNKLLLTCEEGATIVSSITVEDVQRSKSDEITSENPFVISLEKTFTVRAYAKMKDGSKRRSETVIKTFNFEVGDVNHDGKINTVDATEILKMLVE